MSTTRKRAKPTTPEKYLWLRGAIYWFRYGVPKRYQSVETRKIIQASLKTSDIRQASLLAGKMRADLHAEWEGRLKGIPSAIPYQPDNLELMLAATETAYLRIQPKLEQLVRHKKLDTKVAYDGYLKTLRSSRDHYLRAKASEPLPIWLELADKQIQRCNWKLPKDSESYRSFVGMIAEAAIEVISVELAKRQGSLGAEPTSLVVKYGLEAKEQTAEQGETILELFDRYAAYRLAEGRKREDGVAQDRKVIESFASFVGGKRSVGSITPIEIRNWRDTLAALPPTYRKAKAYEGLSMQDAAAKAKAIGVKSISPVTVNKYLSTVSPFLGWCVTNAYAERNPCDGLFFDVAKGKNPRPPFTAEQLRQIFSSPLFTGFLRNGKEHKPGVQKADDWRYWIPIICFFTGARIGEIAQLRIDDVQSEEGIPFLLIRHDEKTGQRTKSGFSRVVPIHSDLQRIGFLSFVERQLKAAKDTGNSQLFPELKENDRGHIGAKPSRFWRDYLKRIGIKTGSDGFGAHSFRHTMADALRTAGYLDDEIEVALGHNQKTVTAGYGKVRQGTVGRISTMIESVRFELYCTI
ncbi:site-specific integrase [Qipengyuania huizhouensis]|uniref:site-specific integrase n=1 Tax=Qipengyuania huizhouensis TaxID=2867245 RepID=UPI001C87297D|nr:site-specific integrase [Qipengyuania huizhouensis]MBX7461514.1 site-specific integrase [Qipengyuania huizhouensis]